jgi:hypothetical protein
MRDDKRNPEPRGNILVAAGDSAAKGTAHPPAGAASGGRDAAAQEHGDVAETDQAREQTVTSADASAGGPAEADRPAPAGPPADAGTTPSEAGHPAPRDLARVVVQRIPAARSEEPSWGKVLGTTIRLWTSRRFQRLTGRSRPAGSARGGGPAERAPTVGAGPRRGRIPWPLLVFVLALIVLALTGLELWALSPHGTTRSATGSSSRTSTNGSLSAAEAARSHAGTWVAQQVSSRDLIACDPLMCSTLQADGIAGSRLMTIRPTSPDPLGTDVVVATSSVRSQFGSQLVSEYAPELMASFGSGASRVDVRAVANFGAAAFEAKERADLTARKAAGAQLLRNGFHGVTRSASQIRAGQVDSRVLVTLAALLSQRQVEVGSFGDTGPGAPALYRQVTIVHGPGQLGTAALRADLSQVRAQRDPYRPAHAAIVQLASGQSALRIDFGAPDQPGLLSGGSS